MVADTYPTLTLLAALAGAGSGLILDDPINGMLEDDVGTTNLIVNPSFEAGLTGYASANTLATSTTHVLYGSTAAQVTTTSATDNNVLYLQSTNGILGSLPVGTYTLSCYVYLDPAWTMGSLGWDNEGGTAAVSMSQTRSATTTGVWQRLTQTFTVTRAGTVVLVLRYALAASATGQKMWVDGVQVEASPAATLYCDGRQPGCLWNGSANASTSYRPNNTLAASAYADISAYLGTFDVQRGSSRLDGPTVHYQPSKITLTLDNADGRFDPTNLTGPYTGAGVTHVRPMCAVQLIAHYAGVDYPLFTGFADSWIVEYPQGRDSVVTLTATDAQKVLANYNPPAAAAVGAGDTSGARINRLLDAAGWAATDRLIQAGQSSLQATTMAQPTWTEILLAADSENGYVWVDASGRVVFRGRWDQMLNPRSSTVHAVFGDADDGSEIYYEQITLSYDDAQLANDVRIARAGGTEQVAQDTASQLTYGGPGVPLARTFSRDDLIFTTDAEAANYASFVLYQLKDCEQRVESIQLATLGVNFTTVLAMEMGDRVRVRRRPGARGNSLIEQDVFVRGIRHAGSVSSWKTTLSFQSATKWAFFILDDPICGVLDVNALAY